MRFKLVLVGAIMLFFLTGCVNGVFHVIVNKDGSGELHYKFAIDSNLLFAFTEENNPLEEFREMAQKDGFIVSKFKDNGYIGVDAKKHVKKISDGISGDLIKYLSAANSEDKINFTIDKGLFFNIYTIKTNINLTSFWGRYDALSQMFLDKMDLRIVLTLPFGVEEHNANRVVEGPTDGDFKTFEWDILPGQNNEIYLEAKVLNVWNIILLVCFVVGALIVALFMGVKRRRGANTKEE